MVKEYVRASNNDLGGKNFFSGIGMLAEGTLDNPVVYNLLYDLPWIDASKLATDEACKQWLDLWLEKYLESRYNTSDISNLSVAEG